MVSVVFDCSRVKSRCLCDPLRSFFLRDLCEAVGSVNVRMKSSDVGVGVAVILIVTGIDDCMTVNAGGVAVAPHGDRVHQECSCPQVEARDDAVATMSLEIPAGDHLSGHVLVVRLYLLCHADHARGHECGRVLALALFLPLDAWLLLRGRDPLPAVLRVSILSPNATTASPESVPFPQ